MNKKTQTILLLTLITILLLSLTAITAKEDTTNKTHTKITKNIPKITHTSNTKQIQKSYKNKSRKEEKIPTTLELSYQEEPTNLKYSKINEEIPINIKLTRDDTQENIENSQIDLQIKYPKTTDTIPVTLERGQSTYTITTKHAGSTKIQATYNPDNNQYEKTTSNTLQLEIDKIQTKLSINEIENMPINSTIIIEGKLESTNKSIIKNQNLKIYYQENTQPLKTIQTTNEGNFKTTIQIPEKQCRQDAKITVNFQGNDDIQEATTTKYFDIETVNTQITINKIQNTKVGEKINITGQIIDENNQKYNDKAKLTITHNNKTIEEIIQINDGKIRQQYQITQEGEYEVEVSIDFNEYYSDSHSYPTTFQALKTNTTLTILQPKNNQIFLTNDKITIKALLQDENQKPLTNEEISIKINNNSYTLKTNSQGLITYTYKSNTATIQEEIKITYPGSNKYKSQEKSIHVDIDLIQSNIRLKQISVTVNKNFTIKGQLYDEKNKTISNAKITIGYLDKEYCTTTDKKGIFNITLKATKTGHTIISARYDGNNTYTDTINYTQITVSKDYSILTIKTNNATIDTPTTITGSLTDSQKKPIKKAKISITQDNITKTVYTDNKGHFKTKFTPTKLGKNTIQVYFEGNNKQNKTSKNLTITVKKQKTRIKLSDVKAYIGESAKIKVEIRNQKGQKVTGGNIVIKVNDKTLRNDYKSDTNKSILKIKNNNNLNLNIPIDTSFINSNKISASYSGTNKYKESKSEYSKLKILKKIAQANITVKPKQVKQHKYITFNVTLMDVTRNAKNKQLINVNSYVIFKINGITLKNSKNKTIKVKVKNNTATYKYKILGGESSTNFEGLTRKYKVQAIYNSPYYKKTSNNTTYQVKKSVVNINFKKVTVHKNTLKIQAVLKDYRLCNVKGKTKYCIKINNRTYSLSNESKDYISEDGVINIKLKLSNSTIPQSVTIVTGPRQAYFSSTSTTRNIIKT